MKLDDAIKEIRDATARVHKLNQTGVELMSRGRTEEGMKLIQEGQRILEQMSQYETRMDEYEHLREEERQKHQQMRAKALADVKRRIQELEALYKQDMKDLGLG